MMIDKWIDLFEKKGYYIKKQPDENFEKQSIYNSKVDQIKRFEEKLKNKNIEKIYWYDVEEEDIEYAEKYCVYLDKEKVDIRVINTLDDYVKEIINMDSSINNNEHSYYRGHSCWRYLSIPSIYRDEHKNILNNEDKLFRDIISTKPHFFNECTTTLEKLVTMQHHGLPTRLLDLTENPLISLFFACNGNQYEGKHGEVTVFKVPENKFKYYDSDTVSVLSNLPKAPISFNISDFNFEIDDENNIDNRIKEFNSREDILKLVHDIREEKTYFLNNINPTHLNNYSIVVRPKLAIDRIVNQSGAFVLFGINKSKERHSDLNINAEGYIQKVIIIPSQKKKIILNQLKLFNINNSTVYCDIDSTAKYFKEKYK
jgi:FRG domain-containing protein